jgi:hypothetical protein
MGDLFLGQASRRTAINLGGASNQQEDLVQRARREREQREQLRVQERAVGKIQVCLTSLYLPKLDLLPWTAVSPPPPRLPLFHLRPTCASSSC